MAQPCLLRTAVPDRSARRLLCPALFTYTRLTRWPHSYRQLVRDRRLMERGVAKVNHMLRSIGGLEYQTSCVMRTKHGSKLHVLETPRESPGPAEAKYTLGDVWRLRLLLLKQLNAIVKAATDNSGDLAAPEAERPRSPQAEDERQQKEAGQSSDPSSTSPLSPSASFPTSSLKASAGRFILYLHGGAFISQSPEFYKIFLNDISRETGARVIAPCYPLAPESLWPSQLHEIFRVYRHLVEDGGIDPNNIVLVGDSAGGNLVVTLLMQIIKHNQSAKDADELNQTAEPLLPLQSIRRAAALYLFGHRAFAQDAEEPMEEASAFRDPWVSPAFLSDPEVLRSFPPVCIHAGSVEQSLGVAAVFPSVQVDGTCDNDFPGVAAQAAADAAAAAAAAAEVGATAHASAAAAADALVGDSGQEDEAAVEASGSAAAAAAAAAGDAAAASSAAAEAAVAEFQDPSVSASSSLGAMISAQVLSFLSPESAETVSCASGLNEGDSDKALPSFFSSTGWLSDSCLKILQDAGTVDVPGTINLSAGKAKTKASVTVWKDEFHVFPCFGFMEEPFASDCIKRIAQWINAQFGETPDSAAAAAARSAPAAEAKAAPAAKAEVAAKAATEAAPAAAAEAAPAEATAETPAATTTSTPQAAEAAAETAEAAATAAAETAEAAAGAAAKRAETGSEAGDAAKEKWIFLNRD
ncbi:hypothetical protein Esti_000513 [Eimeria stiedai]